MNRFILNRSILAAIALLFTVAITGCNTVQGMGEDIQNAGHAIQKAATPNH